MSISVGSLILVHQLIAFVVPGLYSKEAQFIFTVKYAAIFLSLLSIALAYYLVIPLVWYFFISNDTSTTITALNIHFEGKLNEYIFTIARVFLTILFLFIIPLVLFILVKLNIVTLNLLIHQRKFAYIIAFILGALLSPPDVISQLCLAIPLCLSYEVIIYIILYSNSSLECS